VAVIRKALTTLRDEGRTILATTGHNDLHVGTAGTVVHSFAAVSGAWAMAWYTRRGSPVSACGVATHALLPLFEDADVARAVFGLGASLVGLVLAGRGTWALFERLMQAGIVVMFVAVIATAALVADDAPALARGLALPAIPDLPGAVGWTVALIGGVGGTLTVIGYGYWLRETGRDRAGDLALARADLAIGYGATALFGMAMVVVGSRIEVHGSGTTLIVDLGRQLESSLGPAARALFLLGAWCAVVTSLLGVWQSVPYVFADFWRIVRRSPGAVDTRSPAYRAWLLVLSLSPLLGLKVSFVTVQKVYALFGALFLPGLAVVLLLLNGRTAWVGERHRNRWPGVLALTATAGFFLVVWWLEA